MYICADGDPPGTHTVAYSWVPIIVTETILLCLSLYKGWQHRKLGYGANTIMRVLTRDSAIYFIVYVSQYD